MVAIGDRRHNFPLDDDLEKGSIPFAQKRSTTNLSSRPCDIDDRPGPRIWAAGTGARHGGFLFGPSAGRAPTALAQFEAQSRAS
jgi:hypothetical protein